MKPTMKKLNLARSFVIMDCRSGVESRDQNFYAEAVGRVSVKVVCSFRSARQNLYMLCQGGTVRRMYKHSLGSLFSSALLRVFVSLV
jgi:hypothetical protein